MPAIRTATAAVAMAAFLWTATSSPAHPFESHAMDLGNFSVSLAVKDIHASLAFYEKLGFTQAGGDVAQRWVVLQNGNAYYFTYAQQSAKNQQLVEFRDWILGEACRRRRRPTTPPRARRISC